MSIDYNKQSLFNKDDVKRVIDENGELIDLMRTSKNIIQWNNLRTQVSHSFKGTTEEMLMLFGYIDGALHAEVFCK